MNSQDKTARPPFFPRLLGLIGRDDERQFISDGWVSATRESDSPHVIYFEGDGGLGKTRLLLEIYAIAADSSDLRLLVPGTVEVLERRRHLPPTVIDLFDFAARDPVEIMARLVRGLPRDIAHDPTVTELKDAFGAFWTLYRLLDNIGYEHPVRRTEALKQLEAAFVEVWSLATRNVPLALCLDTVEALFIDGVPDGALIRFEALSLKPKRDLEISVPSTAAQNVIQWMLDVFPQLKHTLIILAGRPLAPATTDSAEDANPLARLLRTHNLLHEQLIRLTALDNPDHLKAFLSAAGVEPETPGTEYATVNHLTGNRPLLLVFYPAFLASRHSAYIRAPRTYSDDGVWQVHNRLEYEDWVAGYVLNPDYSEEPASEAFLNALYCLAYARRGLARGRILELFERLGFRGDDQAREVIERLHTCAFITRLNVTDPEQSASDDDLLLLHDEIFQLIDARGLAADRGLRRAVLDYLCEVSDRELRTLYDPDEELAAEEWQRFEALVRKGQGGTTGASDEAAPLYAPQLVQALVNSVTVELTRQFARGYWRYCIAVDRLLRGRQLGAALTVADTFWSLYRYRVRRDRDLYSPYVLAQEDSGIPLDLILRDERVRYVNALRAAGLPREAFEYAEQLLLDWSGEELPPGGVWLEQSPARDPHLLVDLHLTMYQVRVLLTSSSSELRRTLVDELSEELNALSRLSSLKTAVQQIEPLMVREPIQRKVVVRPAATFEEAELEQPFDLLALRRTYFLGLTYQMRGQLYRQMENSHQARQDWDASKEYLTLYEREPLTHDTEVQLSLSAAAVLGDSVSPEIAQTRNNLAYLLLDFGAFEEAKRLSEQVLAQKVLVVASDYQRTLWFTTGAWVAIYSGEPLAAVEPLVSCALTCARLAHSPRAEGLALLVGAYLARAQMNKFGEPDRSIEAKFLEPAKKVFAEEPFQQRAVYHEQARYARDLMQLMQGEPDLYTQDLQVYRNLAKGSVETALKLVGEAPSMARADLFETRASIQHIFGEYEDAHRALVEAERAISLLKPDRVPPSMQLLCGKVALQRGGLLLHQSGREREEGVKSLVMALARAYVFAPRHRLAGKFEQLIQGRLAKLEQPVHEELCTWAQQHLPPVLLAPYHPWKDEAAWAAAWQKGRGVVLRWLADLSGESSGADQRTEGEA